MQAVLVITMVVRSRLLARFVLLALLCFVRAVLPASVFRDFLLSCVALLRLALAALRGMRCSFARTRRSVILLGSLLNLPRAKARLFVIQGSPLLATISYDCESTIQK